MKSELKKNLAASVRQRLLTLSQKRKEPFDLVLVRFGIERLLYRLSRSSYADKFLLKGAMLFAVWLDGTHRPTRDVDLLGFGAADGEELKRVKWQWNRMACFFCLIVWARLPFGKRPPIQACA